MATIPITLYNRYVPGEPVDASHNRLLLNEFGGSPPQPCTPANAGDTLAISLYFLDDPLPGQSLFQFRRYPGRIKEVHLFAFGNSGMYALTTSTTEIVPATGINVSRLSTGSDSLIEKQRVLFASPPAGGTFNLIFNSGTTGGSASSPPALRASLSTTGINFPFNVTAAEMQATLRALTRYRAHDTTGFMVGSSLDLNFFHSNGFHAVDPIVTAITNGFEIQWGVTTGGDNSWMQGIPLITASDTFTQYRYGYALSLALTHAQFIDLFRTANAPAYLHVLDIDGVGGGFVTGNILLAQSDPNTPPTAAFFASVTSGTNPLTVNFSDSSTNSPTSWLWDFGDPGSGAANTSTSPNPSHVYANGGSYTVSLTATNASGADTETKVNYINVDSPGPPAANPPLVAHFDPPLGTTPFQIEWLRPWHPYPSRPDVRGLVQILRQNRLAAFTPFSYTDSIVIDGITYYIVDETDPIDTGFLQLEWERKFSQIPAAFDDHELRTWPHSEIRTYTSSSFYNNIYSSTTLHVLHEHTKSGLCRVRKTFAIGPANGSVPSSLYGGGIQSLAFRRFKVGNEILDNGGFSQFADDADVRIWKGLIWCRTEIFKPGF